MHKCTHFTFWDFKYKRSHFSSLSLLHLHQLVSPPPGGLPFPSWMTTVIYLISLVPGSLSVKCPKIDYNPVVYLTSDVSLNSKAKIPASLYHIIFNPPLVLLPSS